MSLLLDALRKSEDRRRMGRAPGLVLPTESGQAYRRPRRPNRALWLLPLAAVLVVAAAGAWWLLERQTGPVTATAEPEVAVEPVVAPRARIEPEAPGVPAVEPPARTGPETAIVDPQPPPAPATEIAVVPEPQAAPRPQAQAPEAEIAAAPVVDEREEVSETEPERFRPAAPEYVRRWDLPTAVRQNLPELRLTIHVYAANPSERFVLVNGERWVEGDEIAPGVRLREIRREGAVVDYRNYRFLLD